MTKEQACVILDVIECATNSNWPNTVDGLIAMGYDGRDIEEATETLAELAHRDNPISAEDF